MEYNLPPIFQTLEPNQAPLQPTRIAVSSFSSANEGLKKVFVEQSRQLGQFIGEQKYDYYFGGDIVGLMGHVYYGIVDARNKQDCPATEKSIIHGGQFIGYKREELAHLFNVYKVFPALSDQQQFLHSSSKHMFGLPGGVGSRGEVWNTIENLRSNPDYTDKHLWLINAGDTYKYILKDVQKMMKDKLVKEKDFTRVHDVRCVEELKERLYEPPKLSVFN